MYKKTVLLLVLLCIAAPCASQVGPWLELKPSYFLFTSNPMKDIYDKGGFEIQGSVSAPMCTYVDIYGSLGYRQAWGQALNTCEDTSLAVFPIDIGLKPIFNFCKNSYYFFAIGPRFFYFHQHNNSPYVNCKISGGGVGLFINTGFNVVLKDCFLLGIFGEYSYEKKEICPSRPNVFSSGSVQLGGFAIGISLGRAF